VVLIATCAALHAAPVYLNDANITVALGPGMIDPEPFENRTTAASLASVIDAPSASAFELHNQSTHVWVSGGILELIFDFGTEYDLTGLHFWNYHSEGFDVDNIDLTFRDGSMNAVGSISSISPALGNGTGSDSSPIFAEDIALSFPAKVRFVTAILSGSNAEVDFNNIGFTGEVSVSAVPEPTSLILTAFGVLLLAAVKIRANRRVFDQ
jgi:hypothetical protein